MEPVTPVEPAMPGLPGGVWVWAFGTDSNCGCCGDAWVPISRAVSKSASARVIIGIVHPPEAIFPLKLTGKE